MFFISFSGDRNLMEVLWKRIRIAESTNKYKKKSTIFK